MNPKPPENNLTSTVSTVQREGGATQPTGGWSATCVTPLFEMPSGNRPIHEGARWFQGTTLLPPRVSSFKVRPRMSASASLSKLRAYSWCNLLFAFAGDRLMRKAAPPFERAISQRGGGRWIPTKEGPFTCSHHCPSPPFLPRAARKSISFSSSHPTTFPFHPTATFLSPQKRFFQGA